MLKINDLKKVYTTKTGVKTTALRGVSADFGDSGLTFLLGKSGSGKSTLLNLLGGIDTPTGGEIIINGDSSATFKEADFDGYRNTYVGFVFQEYNLIESYTVGANIGLALELQGKKAERKKIDDAMRRVELVDENGNTLYERRTNELSGGQKQRVAIARALVKDPKIILADEPTGALDSKTGQALYELLKELSRDKLVIVVTHDRENAEKYGDRIIELADGNIISDTAGAENRDTPPENKDGNSEFIRGRMRFTRILSMGASGLKYKKIRLAVSILLAMVAFAVFGVAITFTMSDFAMVEVRTILDNNQHMVEIRGYSEIYEDWRIDRKHTDYLTLKQLDIMTKYNGGVAPLSVANFSFSYELQSFGEVRYFMEDFVNFTEAELQQVRSGPFYWVGLWGMHSAVYLDPITGEKDANLRPDERFADKSLCRLPQNNHEIAITDLTADVFMQAGLKTDDGLTHKPTKPDDLIGKTIGGDTICGVYSTEIDKAEIEQYMDIDDYQDCNENIQRFITGIRESVINRTYVHKNRQTLRGGSYCLLKLSDDMGKNKKLFNDLTYAENKNDYSVELYSPYSGYMNVANLIRQFGMLPCIIVAVVFSIFSALLLMNFLNVSIDCRKRELGILRALGASKMEVTSICLVESLIIALIDFVLSLFVTCILCFVLNTILYISVFSVGFLTGLCIFVICMSIAALATILPVYRMASKKPIDVINGK